MGTPLVSVVIPTYNRASLVPRAIESVLAQTHSDFEIIVVDDASTDDTQATVQAYDDDRIMYLAHETNRHVSAARNTGIAHASGEYIAFLDDDDEWRPTKLKKQIDCMCATGEEVAMVYCWMDYRDGETIVRRYRPQLRGDIFERAIGGQPIGGCSTLLVRAEAIDRVGGFDESLPRGNDGDFIRRVARIYQVDYVPEVLVHHYVNHEHGRITEETTEGVENAIRANEVKLEKFSAELAEQPKLKAEIYARLGLRHCQLGNYRTGIAYHLKAIRRDPLNPSVYKQQLVTLHRILIKNTTRE